MGARRRVGREGPRSVVGALAVDGRLPAPSAHRGPEQAFGGIQPEPRRFRHRRGAGQAGAGKPAGLQAEPGGPEAGGPTTGPGCPEHHVGESPQGAHPGGRQLPSQAKQGGPGVGPALPGGHRPAWEKVLAAPLSPGCLREDG